VCSIQHIAAEAFKLQAGVDLLHVPFKGTGEALAALISGDVDLTFSSTGSALPQVSGRVSSHAPCRTAAWARSRSRRPRDSPVLVRVPASTRERD
jgi:tripartite-type tricarboxylate transporter receptor subunit TctC